MDTGDLLTLFWGSWALSWVAAARWSAPSHLRVDRRVARPYRALIVLGAALMIAPRWRWPITEPLRAAFWHPGREVRLAFAWATIPGFLFAWWARLHLGRLWSGTVMRKEGHRVVDDGPYRLVRHPIYTGLIEAALASALASGAVGSLLGAFALIGGFFVKARIEERFLDGQLADYPGYRRRVPMLVPFARF